MIDKIVNLSLQAIAAAIVFTVPLFYIFYPLDKIHADTKEVIVVAILAAVCFVLSFIYIGKHNKEIFLRWRKFNHNNPRKVLFIYVVIPFALGLISKRLHEINFMK